MTVGLSLVRNGQLCFYHYKDDNDVSVNEWRAFQKIFSRKRKGKKYIEISFNHSDGGDDKKIFCLSKIPFIERIKHFGQCIKDEKPDIVFVRDIEQFFSIPTEREIIELVNDLYTLSDDCKCIFVFRTKRIFRKEKNDFGGCESIETPSLFFEIANTCGLAYCVGGNKRFSNDDNIKYVLV